jgi:hypothetical protein
MLMDHPDVFVYGLAGITNVYMSAIEFNPA